MTKGASATPCLPVPGFEAHYSVSAQGVIRNNSTGQRLFGEIDRDGYRRVNLSRDGRKRKLRVHRIVCEAFHGPAPDGCEVCHADGNRLNNNEGNLRWGTRSDNVQDAVRHGTHRNGQPPAETVPRGEGKANAKLTDDKVRAIRAFARAGNSERKIAATFGVSPGQVHKIISREAWPHVHD